MIYRQIFKIVNCENYKWKCPTIEARRRISTWMTAHSPFMKKDHYRSHTFIFQKCHETYFWTEDELKKKTKMHYIFSPYLLRTRKRSFGYGAEPIVLMGLREVRTSNRAIDPNWFLSSLRARVSTSQIFFKIPLWFIMIVQMTQMTQFKMIVQHVMTQQWPTKLLK